MHGNAVVAPAKDEAMIVTAAEARAPSDRDVILASQDESELFETIFDRYAITIHRYLRRRLGTAPAEELTAETFARAFRDRRRFDTRGESALPWLYGIAANLIRTHRRTEERRLRAYARAAERDVEHSSDAASTDRLDAGALGPALAEALATLPPDQREVLLLHAWAELSHAEIAAALGTTAGTIRSRLHRARTHVAQRLAAYGNEQNDGSIVTAP